MCDERPLARNGNAYVLMGWHRNLIFGMVVDIDHTTSNLSTKVKVKVTEKKHVILVLGHQFHLLLVF